MRTTQGIIEEIKELIASQGYIYALCMILFDDFHINPETLHETDHMGRLSVNEASLLLGFFIQKELDFTQPKSPEALVRLKQRTYELMNELHQSLMNPFFESLGNELKSVHKKENYKTEQREFFVRGEMLTEPIFYSGDGVYDFQYLDFLERKYKYDLEWLQKNKRFDIIEAKYIVFNIKHILEEKIKKSRLYGLKERLPQTIDNLKRNSPDEDWQKPLQDVLPAMELHQYVELFFNDMDDENNFSIDEIRERGWRSFYNNIIELFVIKKSDFDKNVNVDAFFDNFSITPQKELNSQFKTIGNYNLINSHPIIRLSSGEYFVPITYLLFQAVYESPFYWMADDIKYGSQAGKNRGHVGEEIVYDFLLKVFGMNRTFKSVKIASKKGHDDTDIDVLCILGSKALCVQIKSKKLTELSRRGDDRALKNDFQKAVQDAYEQGVVSCQKILEREARFFGENGREIPLSEEIDDVYILVITTENYPSLTHQSDVMLDKTDEEPYPIVLTVFDLELLVHYLNDPYDFLYYIKQRTSLMDYFKANEEIAFLGFHLDQKLWKIPNMDKCIIESDFAKLIDRNYYPLKAGLEVSDEGDVIKQRWKDENFDQLCNELKNLNAAKITDILFYLFDLSGEARKNLVGFIISTKQKTISDGKSHDFSLPPGNHDSPSFGASYVSLNSNDENELRKRLLTLCQLRKYKSKGDVWIGFGSLKNSSNMIDLVAFNNNKWEYDEKLEEASKALLMRKFMRLGKKIGRNDACPCGSGLKYKKCCGSKL